MKKLFQTIIIIILCAYNISLMSACSNEKTQIEEKSSAKLKIIATLFPAYDFAKQIAGENAEVTLLVPPGSESHSYEPTPQDLLLLQNCDLFICNGGEGEEWVNQILEGLDVPPETLYMMDCVVTLQEELQEGMQAKGEEGEEEEYDEHVWTSPVNAQLISQAICERLCSCEPELAVQFRQNLEAYSQQLKTLDEQFMEITASARHNTLVFADRFPVRYFTEQYGLQYYAAFPGCADDAEPSAKTVAFLIDRVKEQGIPAVLYIEFSNQKMADIICEETGCSKVLFHSCHNVSQEELHRGITYMELMSNNLDSLKKVLS